MAQSSKSNEGKRETFKEILKANKILDPVSEIIFSDSGLKGENFASQTEYVTIKFGDGCRKPLHLFVKDLPSDPNHSVMIEKCKFFEKEATFFAKYLPDAAQLCQSKGLEQLMDIYPRCYYGDGETIVLDNLVLNQGFTLLNKEEYQDLEATKFALYSLAIHHAIGYAMMNEAGGEKAFFKKYPNLDFKPFEYLRGFLEPMMETNIAGNIRLLERIEGSEATKVMELVKSLQGNIYQILIDSLKTHEGDFLLFCHGDYWNNNMMFLKEKSGKVVDHVLIDFQVTRYNSPGFELGYYLYTSVKPKVRRDNFKSLLKFYLEALKTTSDSLGHPINLSMEQLEHEFCTHFKFGFWFAFVLGNEMMMNAIKGHSMQDMSMVEWTIKVAELVNKYLDENPEKCAEGARNIIELMKEYDQLSNGVIPE